MSSTPGAAILTFRCFFVYSKYGYSDGFLSDRTADHMVSYRIVG